MKVSVILTSYNRPYQIRESIASVQAQTYSNWELFIVDDMSNEETQGVISDIVNDDPRCTVLHSGVREEDRFKTARYASCINLAIPRLSGDLVSYLTDDDIYYPQRFEKMVKVFEEHPEIYVVYGRQRIAAVRGDQIVQLKIRPLVGITRRPMNRIDHNSVMHRRSCFNVVSQWNDGAAHWGNADAAFWKKLAEHWDFHPVDFVTDEHRIHNNSVQAKRRRGDYPWDGGFEFHP